MRKIVILTIIFSGVLSADVLPYKPKPILWVHGLGSASRTWGAPTENRVDSIPKDSIVPGSSYDRFLDYINPYAIVWDEIDHTYTKPTDESPRDGYYPNKAFLEVINFDYDVGSIDA